MKIAIIDNKRCVDIKDFVTKTMIDEYDKLGLLRAPITNEFGVGDIYEGNTWRHPIPIEVIREMSITEGYGYYLYNKYIDNVKSLINSNFVEYKYLTAHEIEENDKVSKLKTDHIFKLSSNNITIPNNYLIDGPDNLSKSIIENGMFWPFLCIRDTSGKIVIQDGKHRLRVLKDIGCINKYLTIIVPNNWRDINLNKETIVYNILPNNFKDKELTTYSELQPQNRSVFNRIDNLLIEIKCHSLEELYFHTVYFAIGLGGLFYNLNIIPSKYINNEDKILELMEVD